MGNFSILPIYLSFLFVYNHWGDWDKILHPNLVSVGDSFKILTVRTIVFLCIVISLFLFM